MRKNIHIFFTINDAYSGYLSACMISILDSLDRDYIPYFYIIDGGISEKNKNKLKFLNIGREFYVEFIAVNQDLFKNLPNSSQSHISNETNYRFLVSTIKPNLDKCIFLDVDLVAVGDISKLWEICIDDYYMAAVSDQAPLHSESWTLKLPLPYDYLYVNTGVTLINLKKWREDNIQELLFQNSAQYAEILQFPDQDTLNITLYKKIKYLSHIYNAMPVQTYYNEKQKQEAFSNPQIIHWAGYKKPWKFPDAPYAEMFWHYARQTPFYEEILFKNITQNSLNIIQNSIQGAVERVKAHLSYKLGKEILSVKENKLKVLILPFALILIYVKHKISNLIFKLILISNPNLKSLPLNHYSDYQEALKIQNYLSYKLGNLLIKYPFTFVFRVASVYKEWKKNVKR
ncbi:glycosyltransferase family 8 protein [Campylobacter jejuni]|uniref:glycosyltransferase family 8 protein n=1 Tax=Campylobacter jejuni TaxID=197 RepID=UPI0012719A21|nr:glycosyltransferase family 8 protein [Campylobacter jejuni]EAJ8228698.1 glycosyltransferase family 8 protein [Campylobacter jejuni]EHC3254537.1 glycosyltransferase family 8 protein [Campylobacter jejuni]MBX9218780.1 glycosyltransferase family 8 protein [Campylobacter jejuni]HDV8169307.1 glycosyltransferase family 8 protein [Campylobacter jejuni]HEH5898437.1 glycosyltransferase family 8 protein [Campylobacter jejuni]